MPNFIAHTVCLAVLLGGSRSAAAQEPAAPDSQALRLELNIPAYRLEALVGVQTVSTLRVAVGARAYPTRVGRFPVTAITWNPWWYPPASDWARNDTVTPPCPGNPMGVVKLSFGNGYFIHGTPAPASLGSAASHGCVRAANTDAQALAELIVRHVQPGALPQVRSWASSPLTRTLRLLAPVPLEIRYDLAEVRGDTLHLYPDIYRRMPAAASRQRLALAALAGAGLAAERVDRFRLNEAIRNSRRSAVAVAVQWLEAPSLAVTLGELR